MSPPSLIVRADGGPGIGLGHLARCLALTQAWVDQGGQATLVSSSPLSAWADRYRREGVVVREAGWASKADGYGDWVVLDGYRFGAEAERVARSAAQRVLAIDDHGTIGRHDADIVLDQNLDAKAEPYAPVAPETALMLGSRYALLRREFRSWNAWKRDIPGAGQRLLVALGGSPPRDVTVLVEEALADPLVHHLKVAWLEELEDVPTAMAWADMALSASGTTCWEFCCLGLPSVLLAIAENQEPVAAAMARHGVADHRGPIRALSAHRLAAAVADLALDRDRRADMSHRGRELVDGRGARRVIAAMRSAMLALRPVTERDAGLLWEWANDPVVRSAAFHGEPIAWESHLRWLVARLADPRVHMYVAATGDGTAIGQVRFEGGPHEAEISVSIARAMRGMGWGPSVIDAGVRRIFAESSVKNVVARIKRDNVASRSAFEDADFALQGESQSGAIAYFRYARSRNAGFARP